MTLSTRRIWSAEEKRAIVAVAETEAPDVTVSVVARRHNLHSSLLFRWRRTALGAAQIREASPAPAFVPLALPEPIDPPLPVQPVGTIEVELAGGHRLRAEGMVDAALLRGVIEALVGR
ncbi:transposase [Lichenihabitans sp. Uapishka_5]|uniref:IS66-like element accessory protein TnpA n=1 Tax=Lichenihabitans sp. Uapishka_5 TaxID=3037302 RepID=UPI0029E81B5A|nr:transposase [Lichenihabitans sp. Uapishka_5]MDX7953990.1 transposase [Lichenihabitans sp. Uapishka_5]